ncbi:S-adenosyl-L-methionine-dependent methyltransferase [Xylaria curta]|nr:S-adenosyl-L-methionine-dependent methyltransferase [Xylaria curta]
MIYKQLDLESDPIKQGFEEAQYDIIVAGSVLHATSDVKATLRNVRKLSKPLGRLVFIEMNQAVEWMNIMWGLLPGWWLSKEPWRLHSPLATEDQWNRLLLETGFTGNDIVIKDNETASHHI